MLFLIVLAILFSVISIYDTKFFYPLLLIFIALFANNAQVPILNFNASFGILYIISMFIILAYKNKNLNLQIFKLYFSSSQSTFLVFIASFMLPFLWNLFYFKLIAMHYLINHISAGLTVFMFTLLTYKSGTVLMDYFRLYAKIGFGLILLIAPQSLIFFFKSGGIGFGRFRSSQIIELPHVWTYQLFGDTYLFKTTTHGSYLITFFSSIMISSLIITYFRTAKWKIRISCLAVILFAFVTTYVNQYISSTLIFIICTFVSAVYCIFITKRKKIIHLIPIFFSIFLISIALTPSSEIIKRIELGRVVLVKSVIIPITKNEFIKNTFLKHLVNQDFLNNTLFFPIAKVDLFEQLTISPENSTDSSNRITLIYTSFKQLALNNLLYEGIGFPGHIDLKSNPNVQPTRHALGIDYLIYFGIALGSFVIILKLFFILFETRYVIFKKHLEFNDLYILNAIISLSLLFLVGRLDYYSWSIMLILGLWITPFIHHKMSSFFHLNSKSQF